MRSRETHATRCGAVFTAAALRRSGLDTRRTCGAGREPGATSGFSKAAARPSSSPAPRRRAALPLRLWGCRTEPFRATQSASCRLTTRVTPQPGSPAVGDAIEPDGSSAGSPCSATCRHLPRAGLPAAPRPALPRRGRKPCGPRWPAPESRGDRDTWFHWAGCINNPYNRNVDEQAYLTSAVEQILPMDSIADSDLSWYRK